MSNRNVAITGGPNNTEAMVTGQQELLVKVNSVASSSDAATETTLLSVDNRLKAAQRTPNIFRYTNSGTIAAGAYSMSIANVGSANATVKTVTLKPGESISFDAGTLNNTLAAVAYDATTAGAELLVITLT
jgi:PPE-repeat protein